MSNHRKIAIITDVHSNKPALEAVYTDAKNLFTDEFWCLGDVIGYGPWPYQSWLFLKKVIKPAIWLPGNHELGLIRPNSSYCQGDAKTIIDLQRVLLEKYYPSIFEEIEQLTKKHVVMPRDGIFLSHGLFDERDVFKSLTSYIDNIYRKQHLVEDVIEKLHQSNSSPKLLVSGHTHIPTIWERQYNVKRDKHFWSSLDAKGEIPISDLNHGATYINPGSVGQPRDGNLLASYCILSIDGEKLSVLFRKVSYPVELTRISMENQGYPSTLITRWYTPKTSI